MHADSFHRRGMTLVELLVVVTIISLLVITVVPNVASTQENRQAREAARTVSSFIAKAHSRAIGRTAWSGFMLVPLASGTAVVDMHLADSPDPYRGDNTASALQLSATGLPTTRTGTLLLVTSTNVASSGDLIRLGGRGPFYFVNSASNRWLTFSLRGGAGQTTDNTPWPAALVPHAYEIFRQPTTAGSPVTLADNRAIDLSASTFGSLSPAFVPNAAITILFDGTGLPRQVVRSGVRASLNGLIFLLVGRLDMAGDPLNPLWRRDPLAFWIGIDPATGAVRSAQCVPDADTSQASQAWIRQALLAGGQ